MIARKLETNKLELLCSEKRFPGVAKPYSKQSYEEMMELLRITGELSLNETNCGIEKNPVDGSYISYAPLRTKRPVEIKNEGCPICEGNTTPVIDKQELPSGEFAFINYNLFPGMSPATGLHLLVWNSTDHKEIHELHPQDHAASIELLSRLEEKCGDEEYVHIIKNCGKEAASSLSHGHYQAILSPYLGAKVRLDREFLKRESYSVAEFVDEKNPAQLEIPTQNSMKAIIPYFMRRPLQVMVYPRNKKRQYIKDLSPEGKLDLASTLVDVTRRVKSVMESSGKLFAYNMVFHTGPIGTMYVEIKPYTQMEGGFEHAGLDICSETPHISAEKLRNVR